MEGMNPYALTAFGALLQRCQALRDEQYRRRETGQSSDLIDDDLELAKFMLNLVMNYLHYHGALDADPEVG